MKMGRNNFVQTPRWDQ